MFEINEMTFAVFNQFQQLLFSFSLPKATLIARIECKCCCTSCFTWLFFIFILQNYVCFGELLSMRILCDAYHKGCASH